MADQKISPHFIVFFSALAVTIILSSIAFRASHADLFKFDSGEAQVDPCELGSGNANLVGITSPQGFNFSVSCLVNAAQQYTNDSRFTFFQPTALYSNMPYIKTPNSEVKDLVNLSWNITLNRSSQLYLFFRRIPGITPTVPSWAASSYTRITPDNYVAVTDYMLRKNADNGLIGLYDVWKSNSTALTGRINFGAASDNVQTSPAYSMYIVGIRPNANQTPQPTVTITPTPTPTLTPTPAPTNGGGGTLVTSGVVYNSDSSANSSRSRATSIRVPENLVPPSQGWMAARMKMGFPNTTTLSPDPNILDMSESDQKSLFLYFDAGSDTFHFERTHSATVASAQQTFAVGALKTVIATWNQTQIKISVDGSTFVSLNNSQSIAQAPIMIGHSPVQGASRQPNSDYYWVAAGTGFLTDANAQTINSFGNTDHARVDFPGNATFVWDAQTDRYNNR